MKRARLSTDSIGQLTLLLVHTVAHIAINDMDDDSNPEFVEELYKCLAVISDDLFYARCKEDNKGPVKLTSMKG